jgi:hypothetical protein
MREFEGKEGKPFEGICDSNPRMRTTEILEGHQESVYNTMTVRISSKECSCHSPIDK